MVFISKSLLLTPNFIKTEFRSQEPEFRMNFVQLVDESRGLRPPLNMQI
jgi:hypothetical protein